jgi:transketolase
MPDFTSDSLPFIPGKAQLLHPGNDLTIIATGHLVWEALQAAHSFMERGISARVLNMHTIKPIDTQAILDAARETGAIVTAEEHQISGGLGGAVAEVIVKNHPIPMEFIGMHDHFGESGQPGELMEKSGMKFHHILEAGSRLINLKNNR